MTEKQGGIPPETQKEELDEPGALARLKGKIGKKTAAVAAGVAIIAGGIGTHELYGSEEKPLPKTAAERVGEAYESIDGIDDLFKTQVTELKPGGPEHFDDYPSQEVPSLKITLGSKETPLATAHKAVLPVDQPELRWKHTIRADNVFFDEKGQEKGRQASWPLIKDGKGVSRKEEPLLMDQTNDGVYHITIPLGKPGEREMTITEDLNVSAKGIVNSEGESPPVKTFHHVLEKMTLRITKAGEVTILKRQSS